MADQSLRRRRNLVAAVATAVAVLVPLVSMSPPAAAAAPHARAVASAQPAYFGIGAKKIQTPSSGSRTIWVALNGNDKFMLNGKKFERFPCLARSVPNTPNCPEATSSNPLRTIAAGIKAAKAGDVIVVRKGTYTEAAGYGAVSGTQARPIEMQSYPGEAVTLSGTLKLKGVSWWTVRGMSFVHNAKIQGSGQSVVELRGGQHWNFTNNKVSGSTGVANILVVAMPTASSASAATKTAAAPRHYTIQRNCVQNNRGSNTHGMDHNIYLIPTVYSTGGLIDRNIISGAPNGSQIKAAPSSRTDPQSSTRNLQIRYNTMVGAAAGVVIGVADQNIRISGNVIANPSGSQGYDAAIKTFALSNPRSNSVFDNLLGYPRLFNEETGPVSKARNVSTTKFEYTGSVANCSVQAKSSSERAKYGIHAGL